MPVVELLRRTPSRELSEWQAYERITGPLGPARDDLHAGIIAATIANSNRGKGQAPYKPSQFIPKWDPQPQAPEHMKMIARAITRQFGGKEVGGNAHPS